MSHAMCLTGLVSGLLIAFIFLLDAIAGLPFGGPSSLDIGFVLGGLMVAYLGWAALRQTN